jgi:serine/threonine protein kinase
MYICLRDIKPSNFVLTPAAHLLLIDFGSSVRLLPTQTNGVQLVPKASCLVLCGTCDYISPEVLRMQEDALVAFDATEEIFIPDDEGGYGRETDWWSLGVTIYELVYGVAPFFAKDIRATYDRIINHQVWITASDIMILCPDLFAEITQIRSSDPGFIYLPTTASRVCPIVFKGTSPLIVFSQPIDGC